MNTIRDVKFINMRKLTTFITAVCVLVYLLCFHIDHHHDKVSLISKSISMCNQMVTSEKGSGNYKDLDKTQVKLFPNFTRIPFDYPVGDELR